MGNRLGSRRNHHKTMQKKISSNETELKKPLAIAEKCKISDLNDDNINKKIPQVATAYIQKLKSSNTSSPTN